MVEGDYFACECEGTDGNPPADVTWYKDDKKIGGTGKEKAILSLSNVDKDENGTYRCEAKSGIEEAKNETLIDLIVNCEYIKYFYRYSKQFETYLKGLIEVITPLPLNAWVAYIQMVTGKDKHVKTSKFRFIWLLVPDI